MIDASLSSYASRRLTFEIGSVIRSDSPYNTVVDEFRATCAASGKEFVSFANYDYIGVADEAYVAERAIRTIRHFGFGVGASRVVGGERSFHRELEDGLARFMDTEACLALVSGYGTNASLIGHVLGHNDLLIYDSLSHSSIMAGTSITRATAIEFPHNDLDALEALLKEHRSSYKRAMIVCEGLYSMDGDCVDLPRVVALKKRYNTWLYVDEAHSLGVLGKTGRGIVEHFGIDRDEIDLTMGTLSKTFGTCGGFIGASRAVIEWLRHTLPGYVYSVGLPPPVAAAATAALEILDSEPERVAQLQHNSRYFLSGARRRGLRTGLAGGFAIIPVHFTSRENALDAYRMLLDNGIYAPPIVQLAVPKDLPRLRMFVSAAHTEAQIDRALDLLEAFGMERNDLIDPVSEPPIRKDKPAVALPVQARAAPSEKDSIKASTRLEEHHGRRLHSR
ncbi:aminotransferase class I/II-fold pyridoxal phosphate-dependent enzyme [Phreatobacter oligotrophus]|uniref:8-amino-7-oxononanoate synthase n=1 Tax=Phreatobacter oligotrophus TaxID=1122261 RepID=A0A2T4Z0V7_9HYPH|nr:aminotransferase class I/II-fold pyridoxal phosphate-dependent enzyme [Phreatobacter oligotrophus]PTM53355.1 8-amino-7-oxononanoate synthase [Phreatobacter oligotrophus]